MTTTPANACATAPDATSSTITMVVKPVPTPQIIGNDTTICSGAALAYTSITASGTLTWNRDGASTGISSTSINITSSGAYTLTENNGACAATSAPVLVTVLPTPAANAGPDQYVEDGSTTSLNGSGGSIYQWTPATGLSDPNIANPSFTVKNDITYTVKVSDATNTCFSTDEVNIIVEKLIIVPNAITPNGDNNNDTWVIKNIQSFPNCVIEIFNRWGTLIWRSNGYSVEWDGTSYKNGEPLPDGTYFYIIDLKSKVFSDPYTGYIQIVK
jgi:gliding motility-associated-like protein